MAGFRILDHRACRIGGGWRYNLGFMSGRKGHGQELEGLADRVRGLRVLVVGDVMLDRFVRGKVTRISPEAPVPVVTVTEEAAFPGGAANVARNLAACGVGVELCGWVGADEAGRELKRLLVREKIGTSGVQVHPAMPTVVKTRVVARGQQLVRVDREQAPALDKGVLARMEAHLIGMIPGVDAVIVEDYGKGFVTQGLVNRIVELTKRGGVPLMVDPNPNNPLCWRGATAIKPNRAEAYHVAGMPLDDSEESLVRVAARLRSIWQVPLLLITLGERGMALFEKGRKPYLSPTKAREVFDVSGAGDTSIALFTVALAAGCPASLAVEIANHAAGVVVGKLGTATLTMNEFHQILQQVRDGI